jgi:GDP-L-fucose synthase
MLTHGARRQFLPRSIRRIEHTNCRAGSKISIHGLAQAVQRVVGFAGKLVCDATKPDGTPRKLTVSSRILGLGCSPEITLDEGIADAYRWFLENNVGANAPPVANVA